MLKCIEDRALPILLKSSREFKLIRRVELLKKTVELTKRLEWEKKKASAKLRSG